MVEEDLMVEDLVVAEEEIISQELSDNKTSAFLDN